MLALGRGESDVTGPRKYLITTELRGGSPEWQLSTLSVVALPNTRLFTAQNFPIAETLYSQVFPLLTDLFHNFRIR